MNKNSFLEELRKGLSGLPQEDVEERLTFYSEMIDDRMEEGFSEEEAVSAVGSVNEIVAQIVADIPLTKIAKKRVKPKRRLKAWEIVFLILGSPIWVSLLIALFAVILAVYIVIWAVIISLWATNVALAASALGAVLSAMVFAFQGNTFSGAAMLGAGIFLAGLSIFMFFGCKWATKGILLLTKKMALGIKKCFIKKEEA